MNRDRRIFIACYAASGAAALLYQVAWTRLFSLQLGHTTAASSTTLAAFMGGMAAGAWVGGNVNADSGRRFLTLYAGIELFIAGAAVLLPTALHAMAPALAWAYADGNAPTSFAMFRVAISLLLMGVPAAAMGATFPIAVRWLAAMERTRAPRRAVPAAAAGALYAANTAGAALGAVATGFWLIPAIGLRATTWVGIAMNSAAAAGAYWLSRRPEIETAQRTPRAKRTARAGAVDANRMPAGSSEAPARPAEISRRQMLAAAAAGLSGFLALVYEVAWTRLLATVLGPTTYAFAIMTASFISGIAIGSLIGTRVVRRGSDPAVWLGGSLLATVVSAPAAAWFAASQLPLSVAAQVNAGAAFDSIVLQQVLAVAGLLLPTSIALGATFVLALAVAAGSTSDVGKHASRVYVANTIGAVTGALSTGFLLIGRVGLESTFINVSAAGAIGGILVLAFALVPRSRGRALAGTAMLAAALVGAFAALPRWDRELLASGAYKYARNLDPDVLDAFLRAGTLEYYKEGPAGTVSVRKSAGSRALAIDGKVDASNAGDMLTQRLLGLLPLLIHPAPRDALIIGLGSGVTADAVLASGDIQHVDVVEISPEVVEASRYFEHENHGVLRKPGVRLLVADGRSHLQLSARQYDVIVSEPSNPWMAGVAALFTREFFEATRARLRPGGVFCQWAHTYEMAEEDLRSIVHTFASVFPDGTLWLVGEGDLLLIGSADGRIESRLPGIDLRSRKGSVPTLLADVGIPPHATPFVLFSLFVGGAGELAAFGDSAPLQTDDRMALEFTAARAMYSPPAGNAALLRALAMDATLPPVVAERMKNASASDWTARGAAALRARAFATALDSFRQSLAIGRSPDALRGLTEAAGATQWLDEETVWLKQMAAAEPGNSAVMVELSHVLATRGQTEDAIAAAREAARIAPARAEPLEQLASILTDGGDASQVMSVARELLERFPQRDDARYYEAAALFLAGRPADAYRPIRTLITANPRHAKGQNLLGAVCASLGNQECARAAFDAALELNPRDPSVYVNLGYLRLARGDASGAVEFFAEALAIDTTSEAARRGLAEARATPP